MSYRETDPVSTESKSGTEPRDPRPLITKLLQIEAIAAGKRTELQIEALDLWQGEVGDLEERFETCQRFLRPGGPADRWLDFLRACGLEKVAAEMMATIHKAFKQLGGPPAPEERKNP